MPQTAADVLLDEVFKPVDFGMGTNDWSFGSSFTTFELHEIIVLCKVFLTFENESPDGTVTPIFFIA